MVFFIFLFMIINFQLVLDVAQITTPPLRVISKNDPLSVPVTTAEGEHKTITELLIDELRLAELKERQTGKMIATLCKNIHKFLSFSPLWLALGNGIILESPVSVSMDIGQLAARLCSEFLALDTAEKYHRIACEVAGFMDDDLRSLHWVSTFTPSTS